MKPLKEIYRNKLFGDYVKCGPGMTEQMVEEAIRLLAEHIQRALVLSGQAPVDGSARVMVANASPAEPWAFNSSTIAAKVRSCLTATPEQFIAYMGFQWKEDRDRADRVKKQYDRLMGLIAEAKSIKWLRERLFHDEE